MATEVYACNQDDPKKFHNNLKNSDGAVVAGKQIRRSRPAGVYSLGLLALLCVVWTAGPVYANEVPASKTYLKNKYSTVLITVKWKYELSMPMCHLDTDELKKGVYEKLEREELDKTPGNVYDRTMAMLKKKPMSYIDASRDLTFKEYEPRARQIGSGFLINDKGYIVTCAHVVSVSEKQLDKVYGRHIPAEEIGKDITKLKLKLPELKKLSDYHDLKLSKRIKEALSKAMNKHGKADMESTISVFLKRPTDEPQKAPKKFEASVVELGKPEEGEKDVAVIKIEGKDLPHGIPMGDESDVQVGEKLFVMSFPLMASLVDFDESNPFVPTITGGIMSAKKKGHRGWTILQTDASMAGGSSGGPIFDTKGKVIGIIAGANIDRLRGDVGIHWGVPATVVKEFLGRANAKWIEDVKDVDEPALENKVRTPAPSQ